MSINILAPLVIVGSIVLIFLFVWKMSKFPRKRRLKFKIIEKYSGSHTFYKVLVKRGVYGWMAFNASLHSGEIWGWGSWSNNYKNQIKVIEDYLSLCGRNKRDYDVTIIDKTTGKK